MIAYLDKYDTTVEVPDDINEKDLQDLNNNFHSYVDQPKTPTAEASTTQTPPTPQDQKPAEYTPNFYQAAMAPFISAVPLAKTALDISQTPEGKAFAGKAIEEGTFGAAKSLMEPMISEAAKQHPAFAAAGEMAGGLGSLLVAGGALRIAGLGEEAAVAGKTAVDAGFTAGQRFIPKAIMTGATFGTRTFIAETVKAFEDGGVNLEQFGKDVLKDTAFGATLGVIGGVGSVPTSIASAGALGFLSSKMSGGDNREASLHAAIWAAFETVGSFGKQAALRTEAVNNLRNSINEYALERTPFVNPETDILNVKKMTANATDQFMKNSFGEGIDNIGKMSQQEILEGIEKVNQTVRNSKVPASQPNELLHKLPAPESATTEEAQPAPSQPQSPLDKIVSNIKEKMGIQEEPKTPEFNLPKGNYDDAVKSLKEQGQDISTYKESDFPDDMKDVYHYEKNRAISQGLAKSVSEISERLNRGGINESERNAVYDLYDINKSNSVGQKSITQSLPDLIRSPIDEQYQAAYQKIASERGIDKGDKFDSRTMEDAKKAVDLINGYFNPKSQEIVNFATTHKELSDHDVAQMAHNRDLIEEPNNDLLKNEIRKAKQAKPFKANSELSVIQPGIKTGEPHALFSYNDTFGENGKERSLYNVFGDPDNELIKKAGWGSSVTADKLRELGIPVTGREPRSLGYNEIRDTKTEFSNVATAPRKEVSEVKQVALHLQESKSEIKNLLTPYKSSELGASLTREVLGLQARRLDMAEASLKEVREFFNKQIPARIIDIYDRAQKGLDQGSPELNAIAEALKKPLRDAADMVTQLTGRLKERNPNYLPQYWKEKADIPTSIKNASKRPFQGSKSFLKKKVFNTQKEGIEAGYTPEFLNPVDAVMQKLREMNKFITAHQTLKAYKKNGLAVYSPVGTDHPDGWKMINDSISDVYKSPMIAVQEAYDARIMGDLESIAKNLGVNLERSTHTKEKGLGSGTLGFSKSEVPGQPGRVWTRFAGPESTLAHELGHQVDNIYGLQSKFLSDPSINRELTDLAHERREGEISAKDKAYIESPPEKMAVMFEAYIHAPDLFKETAPMAYDKLEEFLKSDPKLEPLTKIEPSLLKEINKSEVYAGGSVVAGHYWVQPDAARIINNYLSPGLSQSKIIQGVRFVGNTINQFQLGFSAFHLNFTSTEAIATQLGEALDALANGDIKAFAQHTAKTPIAPISTLIRGDDLLKAWRGQGKSSMDEMLANILAISGGRAHMDNFYQTKMVEQMRQNFQTGKYIQGVLRAPLALVDAASRPIMEHVVPRMKLGIFAEMMETELRNNPGMTHDELRRIGGKVWDTIDDRMGQIVYDNLFWNKTFKDSLMLAFRSVGWNYGLLRLTVGSATDSAAILNDVLHGRSPKGENFYRLKYWIGSAITIATLNGIYQYLKTGKGPSELKDYVFPKNGGVDSSGSPSRSIPFQNYFKDLYHMKTHPVQTFINKLQPMWAILHEALTNKDYFGTKIRNEDDPLVKQIGKEVEFLAKSIAPFSATNMAHNISNNNKSIESVLGPWIGDIPAPYDINQTKAELLAHEITMSHQEIGGRTQEQADRSHLIGMLTRQYRSGDPKATDDLYKAYENGLISHRQMQEVIINSRLTPLQGMVKRMTTDEAKRVYDKSNAEEKAQLEVIMDRKFAKKGLEFVNQ